MIKSIITISRFFAYVPKTVNSIGRWLTKLTNPVIISGEIITSSNMILTQKEKIKKRIKK